MDKSTFIKLPEGSFFHNLEGDEWQVIGAQVDELFCKCTKSNGCFEVGVELFLDSDIAHRHYVGRLPLNYSIKRGETITCPINEALKQGLQVGDRFSIELTYGGVQTNENSNSDDCDLNLALNLNTTQITFVPKEYTPVHDEICNVQTVYNTTDKCRAIHSIGKIYAIKLDENYVETGDTFLPKEIKKFIKIN